jgi:hypothetical protein
MARHGQYNGAAPSITSEYAPTFRAGKKKGGLQKSRCPS